MRKFKTLNPQQNCECAKLFPFNFNNICRSQPFSFRILPSLPWFSSWYPLHTDLPALTERLASTS